MVVGSFQTGNLNGLVAGPGMPASLWHVGEEEQKEQEMAGNQLLSQNSAARQQEQRAKKLKIPCTDHEPSEGKDSQGRWMNLHMHAATEADGHGN